MNPTIVTALIGAAGIIVGYLANFLIQSRRLPSDIKLTEAQAEKTQHETAALLIRGLTDEVARLRTKIAEFETRLAKAEARATEAEERLADAEVRAHEFRRAVIRIGEGRDQDREKARAMVTKLVGVIEHLLACIEQPNDKIIDRVAITQLISEILADYPAEQFVRV